MTITDFLLARIAEDEERAQWAADSAAEHWDGDGREWGDERGFDGYDITTPLESSKRAVVIHAEAACPTAEVAAHVARHDPARVLAECEAKRRIVQLMGYVLESWEANHGGEGRSLWGDVNRRERSHAHVVLDNLAAVYADHPDYREEWCV